MRTPEDMLSEIEDLKFRLSEAQEAIDAIKTGSVDAFAIRKDGKHEVFTLQSLDYAYRLLIEKFDEGALNLTQDGLIIYCNSYFSELIGIPNEKVTGSYIFDYISGDTRDRFYEYFSSAIQGSSKTEIALSVNDKNIPVYISLTSLRPQLATVGMIVTDLSEKKHNERQIINYQHRLQVQNKIFNLAEEIAGIGSYERDFQTGELIYSDNLFRMLGCFPQEFVPSIEKYLSFVHPNDKEQLNKTIREAFKNKTPLQLTYRIISKDREVKHFRITEKIIDEPEQRMIIGTTQDVTSDIMHTETLQKKNIELEYLNKSLDQFASIASHDLQEPLRKIRTFTQLLKQRLDGYLRADTQGLIDKITGSSERMSSLINDVLNFSRIVHTENMFMTTDLNRILDNALADFDLLILEKGASIRKGNLPVIEAIPLQINQLFYNLVGNALKFSKNGISPVLSISSRTLPAEEIENTSNLNRNLSYSEITFEDNGIGFEQQFAEQIFSIFERLNSQREYSGTGIGLALCQKIAGQHQGVIRAEAQENKGARFYVLLPLSQSVDLHETLKT
ncbi:MAG: PAS domain-containing protein [Puia sp.]|nr:PAS domain-containing protein [Puia sp.]